ncbi:hypothetical protein B0H11DRAFT_1901559 [Mycena galericulata]|nr:hypothetical protein B0H11DRAFT_1901559 [Mycena galericulata]
MTPAASHLSLWKSLSSKLAHRQRQDKGDEATSTFRTSLARVSNRIVTEPSTTGCSAPTEARISMSQCLRRSALKHTSNDSSSRPSYESSTSGSSSPTARLSPGVSPLNGESPVLCCIQKDSSNILNSGRNDLDLPPPADWDEVSLSIESDDTTLFPGMDRKVRFVVPAADPATPTPVEEWDEPAWSDFMCLPDSLYKISARLLHGHGSFSVIPPLVTALSMHAPARAHHAAMLLAIPYFQFRRYASANKLSNRPTGALGIPFNHVLLPTICSTKWSIASTKLSRRLNPFLNCGPGAS